jgi:hypothetical protein
MKALTEESIGCPYPIFYLNRRYRIDSWSLNTISGYFEIRPYMGGYGESVRVYLPKSTIKVVGEVDLADAVNPFSRRDPQVRNIKGSERAFFS